MNFDLSLGAGLDQPSFFEVAAHERVVSSLYSAFEHAITVSDSSTRAPSFTAVSHSAWFELG